MPPESPPAEAGSVIGAGLMALDLLDRLDRNLMPA
jgi:hypothetical protein